MTQSEVLTKARGIIEIGWTKGAIALDKDGNRVATNSPTATQWCLVGAIAAAEGWDAVKWNYDSDVWLSVAKSLGLHDRKYDVPTFVTDRDRRVAKEPAVRDTDGNIVERRSRGQIEYDTLIDAIHNQTPLEHPIDQDHYRRIMLDRLHKWHDAPKRTKDEVLKAMEVTA